VSLAAAKRDKGTVENSFNWVKGKEGGSKRSHHLFRKSMAGISSSVHGKKSLQVNAFKPGIVHILSHKHDLLVINN